MERLDSAIRIAREAGNLALRHFNALDTLKIERKGRHDLVSQADRDVETLIRIALLKAHPKDGLIGEEHAPTPGTSGFTWIIDPIDGTSNFLSKRPNWCVAIAGVRGDQTEIGVIFDPYHNELYLAVRGQGATLNDKPMHASDAKSLTEGATGIGHSRYSPQGTVGALVDGITQAGGTITASGSGALSIAYVAAGRTLGHCEGYMNAWDCLAALLMVEEAGGRTEALSPAHVIDHGTRIIASGTGVFDDLHAIANSAFNRP